MTVDDRVKMLQVSVFVICVSVILTLSDAAEPITPRRMSNRPKVLITNSDIPEIAFTMLRKKCDIVLEKLYPTRKEILDNVPGVDALFWATGIRVDDELLDAAGPQLKIVSAMSAGVDQIDKDALKKRNIKLTNTPAVLSNAVADTAILLALAASRRMQEGRKHMEEGTWNSNSRQWLLGRDIVNSTVGIVGLGGIGQAIAKKLKAFDIGRLIYSGHREKPEGKQLGAEFVPFETVLKESDFVIVAAPLTDETRNMFNKTTFSKMKPTAVFVNIARGQIVDQPALVEALKNGTIFAAGLDVMVPEPLPTDSELFKLPNCVLTPHIGSATIDTRRAMAELAANNILLALEGKPLLTPAL